MISEKAVFYTFAAIAATFAASSKLTGLKVVTVATYDVTGLKYTMRSSDQSEARYKLWASSAPNGFGPKVHPSGCRSNL